MTNRFMQRAIERARGNVRSGRAAPFAALVVRDGEIVAEALTRRSSGATPAAHAEVVAIREACRRLGGNQLTGCELYTTCKP